MMPIPNGFVSSGGKRPLDHLTAINGVIMTCETLFPFFLDCFLSLVEVRGVGLCLGCGYLCCSGS